MGIMPPDAVTIAITGSYGSIDGDMSAFTVTPGLRLFPGSNGGPEGPGREIQSYTPNGTSGASVTFTKPFTGSYPTGTKFYIAEGAPSGSAAYLSNQVQKMISYFAGIFGQDLTIDGGSSQQLALRRAAGATFARIGFHLGLSGSTLTFLFGSRNIGGREVMSLQASPNGVQLVDALEVDRDTGGVTFRAAETDTPSAATVDLGAIRSRRIHVYGSERITSLGAGAWQEKIVRFSGMATIVHSAASLALPAARDLVSMPGDVAVFSSDGAGNWRCLSYQRADGSPLAASFGRPDPRTFTSAEPTIDLDFKEGFTHPNFVRSGAVYRRMATGFLGLVSPNVPRIEYDNSGKLLGYWPEYYNINFLKASNDFTNAVWGNSGIYVAPSASTPKPGNGSWAIVPQAVSGPKYLVQAQPRQYDRNTFSVFCKPFGITKMGLQLDDDGGGVSHNVYVDMLTGNITGLSGSVPGDQPRGYVDRYADGWLRVGISGPSGNNNQTVRGVIYPIVGNDQVFIGNGVDGFGLFGAQIEGGAVPGSYIDTGANIGSRGSDILSIPRGDWFSELEGSFYIEAMIPRNDAGYPRLFAMSNGTLGTYLHLYLSSFYGQQFAFSAVQDSTFLGENVEPAPYQYGTAARIACGYKAGKLYLSVNGRETRITNGAIPYGLTELNIGHVSTVAQVAGGIRRFMYFPRLLSAVEMQRMTS